MDPNWKNFLDLLDRDPNVMLIRSQLMIIFYSETRAFPYIPVSWICTTSLLYNVHTSITAVYFKRTLPVNLNTFHSSYGLFWWYRYDVMEMNGKGKPNA